MADDELLGNLLKEILNRISVLEEQVKELRAKDVGRGRTSSQPGVYKTEENLKVTTGHALIEPSYSFERNKPFKK